ncbi:CPBP family intramembrane metalloprotease [Marinilongibacter aquaticus]|uniref:CPBP family intramembrane glutamic endopeptidase n=1 Tax=Marinilongibacter aquaticus TaxID=2975157 RepID=UPI0021BD1133|nr:CPBP family intramembrane glutamic endopeptidase [Marinilongibacter aquaticus]UBM58024.1 CPBP family intramembrane metalloprotease [Marinilongibacter aquaticus]
MSFDSILQQLRNDRPALSSLLILLGIVLIGMVIGNILGAIALVMTSGINELMGTNPTEMVIKSKNGWWGLIMAQGLAEFVTFILAGVFFWKVVEKKKLIVLNFNHTPQAFVFITMVATMLAAMPLMGYIQEINAQMKLPESLHAVEDFMRKTEDQLAEMTEMLTDFKSFGHMLVGFVVIAIFAGVGEELVFRGLLQRKLYLGLKNPHLAIWLTAIIFSAIHFQFYGFLPRMLLGALFGYLFYWSGNLWLPIAAHIFNNGFAVVMYYLYHEGHISKEVVDMNEVPLSAVLISIVLVFGLLWYLVQQTKRPQGKISE